MLGISADGAAILTNCKLTIIYVYEYDVYNTSAIKNIVEGEATNEGTRKDMAKVQRTFNKQRINSYNNWYINIINMLRKIYFTAKLQRRMMYVH